MDFLGVDGYVGPNIHTTGGIGNGSTAEPSNAWFMPFNMDPLEIGQDPDVFNISGEAEFGHQSMPITHDRPNEPEHGLQLKEHRDHPNSYPETRERSYSQPDESFASGTAIPMDSASRDRRDQQEINELTAEIAFQKVLLPAIDDSIENGEEAEAEVAAETRNLEKTLLEQRKPPALDPLNQPYDRPRRESLTGSLVGGMSWGGTSVGTSSAGNSIQQQQYNLQRFGASNTLPDFSTILASAIMVSAMMFPFEDPFAYPNQPMVEFDNIQQKLN